VCTNGKKSVGKKCVLAKDKSGRNNENKEGKMKEKNDK
jgi:hypothetical protein